MLTITDEVRDALASGQPVVALESTIISHGMPYPQNVEMARTVEGIVRDGGAVPATIAVLHGRPTIGLSPDDLELLASDESVIKVSIRDLPYVVSRGLHGATTVASTTSSVACHGGCASRSSSDTTAGSTTPCSTSWNDTAPPTA